MFLLLSFSVVHRGKAGCTSLGVYMLEDWRMDWGSNGTRDVAPLNGFFPPSSMIISSEYCWASALLSAGQRARGTSHNLLWQRIFFNLEGFKSIKYHLLNLWSKLQKEGLAMHQQALVISFLRPPGPFARRWREAGAHEIKEGSVVRRPTCLLQHPYCTIG